MRHRSETYLQKRIRESRKEVSILLKKIAVWEKIQQKREQKQMERDLRTEREIMKGELKRDRWEQKLEIRRKHKR